MPNLNLVVQIRSNRSSADCGSIGFSMMDAIASQPLLPGGAMQADEAPRANSISAQHRKKRKSCLLLVGSQNAFKSAGVVRVFGEHKFELVARSSTLVEALACLTPGAIELVVTSNEFTEQELELFAIEAPAQV